MVFSWKWFGRLFLPDGSTLHDSVPSATPKPNFFLKARQQPQTVEFTYLVQGAE